MKPDANREPLTSRLWCRPARWLALVGLFLPTVIAAEPQAVASQSDSSSTTIEFRSDLLVAQRRQPYRVLAPVSGEALPLILFSHGAYSSNDLYDPILLGWARAGFIVIAPTHADSTALGTPRGSQNAEFFAWRLADMTAILDSLPDILGAAELTTRADARRIALTGHSFGGLVAQTLAGAGATLSAAGAAAAAEPAANRSLAFGRSVDPRIRGAIVFSGGGVIPGVVTGDDLAKLTLPLLVTVGTDDLAQAPGLSGYEWRRQPFDFAGSLQRLLLIQHGADHYLGGQVGRNDLAIAPYAPALLHDFLWLSTLWLQGWLQDSTAARERLDALGTAQPVPELQRATVERPTTPR